MSDDAVAIWRFLSGLELIQNPDPSPVATRGWLAIEVLPAPALPSLLPDAGLGQELPRAGGGQMAGSIMNCSMPPSG